jgi:protein-S-isoprenylcysteine O-methyltransferase Ste14
MALITLASWGKLAQKIRVPAGTLIGIVFLLLMHPSRHSLWIGGGVTLAGAILRIWAAGHIEKGRVLTQTGPYAFTRNPLYLGSLVMALGILVAGQGYWLLIPFVLSFAAFYYPVMKAEEEELLLGHGERFRQYSRQVPLFFPRLRASEGGSARFLWSRVVRNREHKNLAGLLLAEIFLIVQWLYPDLFPWARW